MLGAHLKIMAEVEVKLCLVEVPLELMEEEMQDMEALEAGEDREAMVGIPLLLLQQGREVSAEREVMVAAVEQEAEEGRLVRTLREQEVQQGLVVLEEEVELVEVLGRLVAVQEAVMVVMAEQEVMAEAEEQEVSVI